MSNVRMLRTEPDFVCIPIEQAMYCTDCQTVNNSSNERCGHCGGESLRKVTVLIEGPPNGPGPGSAPPVCIVPTQHYKMLGRAA